MHNIDVLKFRSREPLPLLATDQDELQRKIESKVSELIAPVSSADKFSASQNQYSKLSTTSRMAHFPESRIRDKYTFNTVSLVKPKASGLLINITTIHQSINHIFNVTLPLLGWLQGTWRAMS